jgi:catechol 2,3-dioxygenase-like lactoylglutathione lyase family enzyme
MELTFSHIMMGTQNVEAMHDFYVNKLGFTVDEYGVMSKGGVNISLDYPHSEAVGKNPQPFRTMIDFDVTDIFVTVKEMKEKGIEFVREPEQESWGGYVATFTDPDGNYLQLFQNPQG